MDNSSAILTTMNKDKNREIDQLYDFLKVLNEFKKIERLSLIAPNGRRESDAEHTWNLTMTVWLYSDLIDQKINLLKAVKIALVHDLVEIYAGDVFDGGTREVLSGKEEREHQAADRLFSQLTSAKAKEFFELWNEFENRSSLEAGYVWVLDKLAPRFQQAITGLDASDGMVIDHERDAQQDKEIEAFSPIFKKVLERVKLERGF